eukprot:IDg14755t1
MHKKVESAVSSRRERAISAHKKETNIVTPKFIVGDFVLVRRAQDHRGKLQFCWFGPYRITAVHGNFVYEFPFLRAGKPKKVHCTRLIMYRDSLHGQQVPDDMLELAERTEIRYEIIEKIIDVREADGEHFFQVQWVGLPDERDFTWNPIDEMY